jgi:hypothetical protein
MRNEPPFVVCERARCERAFFIYGLVVFSSWTPYARTAARMSADWVRCFALAALRVASASDLDMLNDKTTVSPGRSG